MDCVTIYFLQRIKATPEFLVEGDQRINLIGNWIETLPQDRLCLFSLREWVRTQEILMEPEPSLSTSLTFCSSKGFFSLIRLVFLLPWSANQLTNIKQSLSGLELQKGKGKGLILAPPILPKNRVDALTVDSLQVLSVLLTAKPFIPSASCFVFLSFWDKVSPWSSWPELSHPLAAPFCLPSALKAFTTRTPRLACLNISQGKVSKGGQWVWIGRGYAQSVIFISKSSQISAPMTLPSITSHWATTALLSFSAPAQGDLETWASLLVSYDLRQTECAVSSIPRASLKTVTNLEGLVWSLCTTL